MELQIKDSEWGFSNFLLNDRWDNDFIVKLTSTFRSNEWDYLLIDLIFVTKINVSEKD